MSNPNPMHSRCGLEDCDCEYTIGYLLTALRQVRDSLSPEDSLWSVAEYAIDRAALDCPLCARLSPDGEVHQECAAREQYAAECGR